MKVKVKVAQSCPTLCNPMDYTVHGILQARILEWVAFLSLLQESFPTQWSNPGFPHCRWILYQLSHQGSPRILEWVGCPFPRGSSWARNWTRVSCIAEGFFTNSAIKIYFIYDSPPKALDWFLIFECTQASINAFFLSNTALEIWWFHGPTIFPKLYLTEKMH